MTSAILEPPTIPIDHTEAINARILAVSEDQIQGFQEDPIGQIAELAELPVEIVTERIRAMLAAGTVRRVRQTLMATNLARGALVAWQVPQDKLQTTFDFMFQQDPFTGHVVIRSTDAVTPGSNYRLWTTVKVPQGYSIDSHCAMLKDRTGADRFLIMPAKGIFALGVGHVRRSRIEIGSRAEVPAEVRDTEYVELNEREWRILMELKRELNPEEVGSDLWKGRARDAGVSLETFVSVAHDLDKRRVIGRFSTFLEHVKPLSSGDRVTRFNGLFHWAVPAGREIDAGKEVGRHHILTHCYWRDAGPEFRNVNIMAVAHGRDKELVLAHKAAIDRHLEEEGIPVTYTNTFWGGRSEIKPSEISPFEYVDWCRKMGVDPVSMKLK